MLGVSRWKSGRAKTRGGGVGWAAIRLLKGVWGKMGSGGGNLRRWGPGQCFWKGRDNKRR